MPNNTKNLWVVRGPEDDVDAFVKKHMNGDFTFNSVIPMPDKVLQDAKAGANEDWYEWSNNNWGTKWDAYSHGNLCETGVFWKYSGKWAAIDFESAWSPPMPVLKKLREMHPKIQITVVYYDEYDGMWHQENGDPYSPVGARVSAKGVIRDLALPMEATE